MSAAHDSETTAEDHFARIGTLWLRQLAGQTALSDDLRSGLPADALAKLFERLVRAKEAAGLTTKEFRALRRSARTAFCERFAFTRLEVRLAQAIVEVQWSMWRGKEIARRAGFEHRRRSMS